MIIIAVNLGLLLSMFILYNIVESRQRKSLFYDPSWRVLFIIFITPITHFLINIGLLLILNQKEYLLYSLVPLIIPSIFLIINSKNQSTDNKKFNLLKKDVLPIVMKLLEEQNVEIDDIRLIYYRQLNENHLDIRISLTNYDKKTLNIINNIEDLIDSHNATINVITKIFIEKKSNSELNLVF